MYQVQVTIDRWLSLRDDEVLELECGEDIDTVSAWSSGTGDKERLLEQIKHLDRTITLNSTEARAALANFVEHRGRAAAPEHLRFRFVTTALPALERAPHMPRNFVGIDAWQAVRSGSLGPREELTRLAALRMLLRRGARRIAAPAGVPDAAWLRYIDVLDGLNLERGRALVHGFEWSTGNASVGDEEVRLRALLREVGFAVDEEDASRKYAALFTHVFRTLSQKGPKRLTSAERLALLTSPIVSSSDRVAVDRLSEAVAYLEAEVVDLRSDVDGHEKQITDIVTQLARLGSQFGMQASFSPTLMPNDSEPPPASVRRAIRARAVAAINRAFAGHAWVALEGTNGAGKTELAIEMAEARGPHRRWIGLRDLDESVALFRLRHAFAGLAPTKPETDRRQWYLHVAQQLPEGYLVVLDDLPTLDADAGLGREITAMVLGFRDAGRHLLTTSARALDPRLTARLGETVVRHPVPPFDSSDIALLLEAHGAPENWRVSPAIELIASVTAGHAELVVAAMTFLERRKWKSSTDELGALLKMEHAVELQVAVLRRLVATVESEVARQLLFRCALIIGDFSMDEVAAIAAVTPVVTGPRSHLVLLEGLWVQAMADGTFSVCPSAKTFGDEVPAATKREVYGILARRIVNSKKIGPIEAHRAIVYFLGAENFDGAVLVLCIAFEGLARAGSGPQADAGLLDLWMSTPLPRGANLGLRVHARSLQIAALARRSRTSEFVMVDLLTLAKQAAAEAPWALVSVIAQAKLLSQYDYAATTALVVAAALGPDRFEVVDGPVIDFTNSVPLTNFLWHQASYARSPADRRLWLDTLRGVNRARLRDIAKGVEYELSCMGLCDGVWVAEAKKPENLRQWGPVHQELVEIADVARFLGLPLLAALARRCRVMVSADYEKDMSSAARIAAEATDWELAEPAARLLIFEALGRGFVAAKEDERGKDELRRAIGALTSSFPIVRLQAMLWLSRALGAGDLSASTSMADSALTFAQTITFLPGVELAKVFGEVAAAHWRASAAGRTWRVLEEGVRILHKETRRGRRWKDAMVLFGHATTVVWSVVVRGRPADPILLPDGTEEPAAEFTPGMFLSHNEKRYRLYKPENEYVCVLAFLNFADRFAADELLPYWVERATASQVGAVAPAVTLAANLWGSVDLAARGEVAVTMERARTITVDVSEVAFTALVAVAGLAKLRVEKRSSADAEVARTLDVIERGVKDFPSAEAWALAGEIIRCSFREEYDDRLARLEVLYNAPQVDQFLRWASRVGASVQDRREFHRALEDHLNIAIVLDTRPGDPLRTILRRLVGPLVSTYWRNAVELSAMQFRSPSALRGAIYAVKSLSQPQQAKRVLHEVASSLSVKLPGSLVEWLQKED